MSDLRPSDPDVFLSYAREDEARARDLARALQREGLAVFWDHDIPPGQTWHSYIGAALASARCVVVAWSSHSVAAQWVIEEASEGKGRNSLVPVLFDAVQPPFGFRAIQAASLIDWRPGRPSPAFDALLGAVRRIAGGRAGSGTGPAIRDEPSPESVRSPPRQIRRRPYRSLAAVAAMLIAVAGATGAGFYWWPTQPAQVGPTPSAGQAAHVEPSTPEMAAPLIPAVPTAAKSVQDKPILESVLKRVDDLEKRNTTLEQEYIYSVTLSIDASYPRKQRQSHQGFSTIASLAGEVAGRAMSSNRLGIKLTLDYGPFELYVFGTHIPEQREEWFLKFFFDDNDLADYYETDPIPIDLYTMPGGNRLGDLFKAALGVTEIGTFLRGRALLRVMHKRPAYTYEDFDPGFELGVFKLSAFVVLPDQATGFGFAKEFATDWPKREDTAKQLSVSDEFFREWIVQLEVNDRRFYNLSGQDFTDADTSKRLLEWDIQPKYRRSPLEIFLAPNPGDWIAFRVYMTPNVQQLLYGDRGEVRPQRMEDVLPPEILRRIDGNIQK